MVSLYFNTSCLFSCVLIDCQRWYEVHVGGLFDLVWVRVAKLVRTFGLSGLWVAGYSFCENVHPGCHCDPRDARLAVLLCTTDGACTCRLRGTQPPESRRSEEPMPSLPLEEACKRVRWCCMRCSMGLGFLTLGDSIDVVRFPGCLTLSDWCVVRSKDGDVQCFSERMSWLVERRFWSEEKGLSLGPEAWLSRAGSQCQRHWERWLSPARRRVATHVWSVRHARVDPELSGSLKSQGFRRQYEGFCQARAPFAASHLVSRSASY